MSHQADLAPRWVTIRLCPGADTATLLRVVSILHGRGTLVRRLRFDADGPQGPTITAEICVRNVGLASVGAALTRSVEVSEVCIDHCPEAARVGHGVA